MEPLAVAALASALTELRRSLLGLSSDLAELQLCRKRRQDEIIHLFSDVLADSVETPLVVRKPRDTADVAYMGGDVVDCGAPAGATSLTTPDRSLRIALMVPDERLALPANEFSVIEATDGSLMPSPCSGRALCSPWHDDSGDETDPEMPELRPVSPMAAKDNAFDALLVDDFDCIKLLEDPELDDCEDTVEDGGRFHPADFGTCWGRGALRDALQDLKHCTAYAADDNCDDESDDVDLAALDDLLPKQ